jgi:uncharacterized protein YodC (DUF2158 family)
MADFQEGDLVKLKSGGPVMTVESVFKEAMTKTPKARVSWFKGEERQQETFSPDALTPVEEDQTE